MRINSSSFWGGLVVAISIMSLLNWSYGLWNLVHYKNHGFYIQPLVMRYSPQSDSAKYSSVLNGCTVKWIRRERWGPISNTVLLDIKKENNSCRATFDLPYDRDAHRNAHIADAVQALQRELVEAGLAENKNEELRTNLFTFIRAALQYEAKKSTETIHPRLDCAPDGVFIAYPYVASTVQSIATQVLGSAVLVLCAFVVLLLAHRGLRERAYHPNIMFTAQALASGIIIFSAFPAYYNESCLMLRYLVLCGCALFGFLPLVAVVTFVWILERERARC